MQNPQHCLIYIANKENKIELLHQLLNNQLLPGVDLANKNTALFSKITLNTFLEEEYQHDNAELTKGSLRLLSSLSEGEQKKALLAYLLAKNPDYLIVDNIFDNLDNGAQQAILHTLEASAKQMSIIQLANRQRDFLPFITISYQLINGMLQTYSVTSAAKNIVPITKPIPAPYKIFQPSSYPIITMHNISVSYDDVKVLHNIDWQINAGEFWQLMGPNGAGKSTLISLITGDNPKAYQQDLTLFGRKKGSGESIWDIRKNIGYFTNALNQNFPRSETVENMILSGFFDSIGLYDKPTKQQRDITQQWLQLIGLEKSSKLAFNDLSLGHQRLVMIIRAMIKHPPLLILDEPVAGLDDEDAYLFSQLINAMAKQKTSAILYVSHRKEQQLQPEYVFSLTPTPQGSTGKISREYYHV